LSTDLKAELDRIAQENFRKEKEQLEEDLPRIKGLILKISELKQLEVLVWMEGTRQTDANRDQKNLGFLERSNLVKSKMKYTHRNTYRVYELTVKGAKLAEKLAAES
jgi:hypothetical protein